MNFRTQNRLTETTLVWLAVASTTLAQAIHDPVAYPGQLNNAPLFRAAHFFAEETTKSLHREDPVAAAVRSGDSKTTVNHATSVEEVKCTTTEQAEIESLPTQVDSCTTDSCTTASADSGKESGCGLCGALLGWGCDGNLDDPCAKSHGKLHYWNNYDYLDDPEYDGCCLGNSLKRLGKNWNGCCCIGGTDAGDSWIDVGGRFRLRYHNEQGLGRAVGSQLFDDTETNHLLLQARIFGDWHINKQTRVFVEGLYADVTGNSDGYRPRANERNRGDFLNLFIDMKIAENTTVRFGRQQLLYGSRRLIAGPGWANTSRSHDGIKVIQKFGNFRFDTLFMKRVPVSVDGFDEPDYERTLFGGWATYKGSRDKLDAYYLGFDDDRPGTKKTLHTIGAQLSGGETWLYDIEGAAQFGTQDALGLDHAAAFSTAGVGRKLKSLPWSPTLWAYYDFATGDTTTGSFNRFDRIFNRAHHYLGFIDLAHRSNVEIPSLELTLNPTKRFKILTRYFHIMANQENDTVAALGGLTADQNTTSADYGDTVDIAGYYKISPRSNARVGYSHFWPGNKVISDNDASFTYAEWAIWF